MRLSQKIIAAWLLTSICCFANSEGTQPVTLGFYITGETGIDVLDTIIPELARLSFAEAIPRDISVQQFPVATFRRANGDEIQVTAGKRCALVAFYGARVLPGTELGAFAQRFTAIHANLKKYIARLPQPHPVILEGEMPARGLCPSEF
jgi:hypothetical protein